MIIEHPDLGKGKEHNDYGRGFYCTESLEMAKEWACAMPGQDGYANCYKLDNTDMKVLNLSEGRYHVLNWLAVLAMNRDFRASTPIGIEGKEYIIREFGVDLMPYDIIRGYRADDSYFAFARAFVNNTITATQLREAMKLGKLGEQVVLKTEKAFHNLNFAGKEFADGAVYFAKREQRARNAEKDFREIIKGDAKEGLYMIDILREGMKNEDLRLR
jgi:hypothetical protein